MCNLSQHDVNEFPEKNKGGTCKEWKRILQGWVVCQCHSWSPSGPKGKHSTYVALEIKEEQSRGTVDWLLKLNCFFEVSSSLHSDKMTQQSGSLDFLVVGLQFFLFVLPCIQIIFEVSTARSIEIVPRGGPLLKLGVRL